MEEVEIEDEADEVVEEEEDVVMLEPPRKRLRGSEGKRDRVRKEQKRVRTKRDRVHQEAEAEEEYGISEGD